MNGITHHVRSNPMMMVHGRRFFSMQQLTKLCTFCIPIHVCRRRAFGDRSKGLLTAYAFYCLYGLIHSRGKHQR